jgi:acetolactate synthase II small subunit
MVKTNMNHTLRIQLSSCEGSVIRALGLIERRGFNLNKCSVGEPDGTGRVMEVNVSSTRPGDLLKRQLERLHDVFVVELEPAVTSKPHTPGIRPINWRI